MSANKLYIGNLSYDVSEDQLSGLFSQSGEVLSCRIIRDRDTGRSKGFGFVEMSSGDDAESAISQFDGTDLESRPLRVSIARERRDNQQRGGGGGQRRHGGPRY